MFSSEFEWFMWCMVIDYGYLYPDDLVDFGNMLIMGGEL
jgi:hypothetical protein